MTGPASGAARLREALRRQAKERDRYVATVRGRAAPSESAPHYELPPTDPVAFCERLQWPHIQTGQPVGCLNPITLEFLENRASFRYGADGAPRSGSDIVGKPRRVQMSCLIFSLITQACLLRPNTRAVTTLQSGQPHIVDPIMDDLRLMVQWMPREWAFAPGPDGEIQRVEITGRTIRYPNGSTHRIMLSGSSKAAAGRVGRAGRIDIFHGSEVAYYSQAATTMQAALAALDPGSGWAVIESTFGGSRLEWHAQEFARSLGGAGRFSRAHFWPWHRHPLKRLPAGSQDFARFLADDFPVTKADLAREDELGLDTEQRAFRRSIFCTGSLEDRRRAKGENPEEWEDAFEGSGQRWLGEDERVRLGRCVSEPLQRLRHSDQTESEIWHRSPDRVVVGVDTAEKTGVDRSAAVFLDPVTRGVVALVHGRALASEMADAIEETLRVLVGLDNSRYTVNVERNVGKALIGELARRRIRLFSTMSRGAGTVPESVYGTITSGSSRPVMIDLIAQAIQRGDEQPSDKLLRELLGLEVVDGRVQAATAALEGEGRHRDDIVMAWAMAHYAAQRQSAWTESVRLSAPARVARPFGGESRWGVPG